MAVDYADLHHGAGRGGDDGRGHGLYLDRYPGEVSCHNRRYASITGAVLLVAAKGSPASCDVCRMRYSQVLEVGSCDISNANEERYEHEHHQDRLAQPRPVPNAGRVRL